MRNGGRSTRNWWKEGQKPSCHLLVIKEKVIRHTERTVGGTETSANHNSRDQDASHIGHKHNDHGENTHPQQHLPLAERSTKSNQRVSAHKVEVNPPTQKDSQHEQVDRVQDQAQCHHGHHGQRVVDAEVAQILSKPDRRVAEWLRFRELWSVC